jgi:multidrug efflux pump subunit AcrA (membrane-fusion protein)
MKGPDPTAVRVAEREVGRAQEALRAAQGLSATDDKSRASRDQAISDAQLNLQYAQDRLARLQQPPLPSEMELAQYNLDAAKLVADAARERLQRLKAGPDPDAVEKANAAVDAARATLQLAEGRAAEVSARASREQSDTEERVSAAQAALDRARSAASGGKTDPDHQEVVLLEKSLERGQTTVKELEEQLASMRVPAPFAGAVVAVMARPGDQLEPGKQVAVLAKPGDPIVRVELAEQEASRVAVGQRATVRLDEDESQPLSGTVAAIAQVENSAARIAQIHVIWPSAPSYGAVAKTAVAVQEKDNVLLIPKPALRSAGARKYVESVEGASRRSVDVEVGIAAATDVEILGGLREGQIVLVGTGA